VRFYDTEKYQFEFFVELHPSDDKARIAESWRRMAAAAQEDVPGSELAARRALSDALDGERRKIAEAEADLPRAQEHALFFSSQLEQARERGILLSSQLEQARGHAMLLSSQLEQAKEESANAQQQLRQYIARIEESRSWRITRPIREVARVLRRQRDLQDANG
jgi:chromosome segregation ATPase